MPLEGARITFFDLADLRRSFSSRTDAEGRFALALESAPVPTTFRLLQNFPNPFNPSTTIPYELQETAHVRLEVFNLLGQQIRTLVDEVQAPGSHTAVWDARDEQGAGVGTGIYIYRITVDGISDSRQLVLVDGPAAVAGGFSPAQVPASAAPQAAHAYGVVISGPGISTYVQSEILIDANTSPLSFAVDQATAQASSKVVAAKILGDVNNDGRVNISDALIVATYGIDRTISIPNNGDISLGDVNKDSRVNISDALIIATYGIDPTNPALPRGIGQAVGPPPLTGQFEITSITPTSGKPGENVTLRGRFSAPGAYWVAFDTLRVPALSQSDAVVTTLVPLRSAGTIKVAVLDTLGHRSNELSFGINALSAPRHTAAQTASAIQTAGERIAQSVPALMEGTGFYSSSELCAVRAEFTRWGRVLPLVVEEIRQLPANQARQVTGILENSGALEVLEELGGVEIGAPKVAVGAFDAHHLLVRADGLSFMLGNVNALLKAGGVALLFTGGGAAVAAIIPKISLVLSASKNLIDGYIPSDLETFQVLPPGEVEVGKSAGVQFKGNFKTESTPQASTIKSLVEGILVSFPTLPKDSPLLAKVIDRVNTTLVQAGIAQLEQSLSADLEPLKREQRDVSLDFALYSLDLPAVMDLLGLPGATTVRLLTTSFQVDLHLLNAVTVSPSGRADFAISASQLTGRSAGSGTLNAQAFTFKRWNSFFNLLGFMIPQSVGPVSATFQVKAANRPPVANAGVDQNVQANQPVTLDASGSSDPDGDSRSYQWRQVSGPSVSLTNGNSNRASFRGCFKTLPQAASRLTNRWIMAI